MHLYSNSAGSGVQGHRPEQSGHPPMSRDPTFWNKAKWIKDSQSELRRFGSL